MKPEPTAFIANLRAALTSALNGAIAAVWPDPPAMRSQHAQSSTGSRQSQPSMRSQHTQSSAPPDGTPSGQLHPTDAQLRLSPQPPDKTRRFIPKDVAIALLVAVAASYSPPGSSKPDGVKDITWLIANFAPVAMPVNGRPTDGFTDKMVLQIVKEWPEAQHSFLEVNANRAWKMIEAGEHVCQGSVIKTAARGAKAYFVTTHLVPPLQLVARKDKVASLPRNAAGEVDLRSLLDNQSLRGLLVSGRSYGAAVDDQLDPVLTKRGAGHLSVRLLSPSDYGARLLQMLSLDRADYTIDYDFTLKYHADAEQRLDNLVSLPIAGASAPLEAGVACARTEWGLKATQRIQRLVRTPQAVAVNKDAFMSRLTIDTARRYGRSIDRFYQALVLSPQSPPSPRPVQPLQPNEPAERHIDRGLDERQVEERKADFAGDRP